MNENNDIDTTLDPDDSASPAHGDEHLSGHDPKTWGTPLPETPEGASFRFFHSAGPKRLRCVRSHMCDYAFQP